MVARYDYNELGQLKDKNLGLVTSGAYSGNYLQKVDFRFNIRGWLTSINNSMLSNDGGTTSSSGNNVWGETILYEQIDATGLTNTPRYNGKISEIKWQANDQFAPTGSNPVRQRSYTYTYDSDDRLVSAQYAANGGSAWNAEIGGYNETVGSYDNNGNIRSLSRNTFASGATAPVTMDQLTYNYTNGNASNQLQSVTDVSGNAMGYNGTVGSANQYSYDADGSLTGDVNKGQTITYNDLNKVSKVSIAGGGSIQYTYDASGTRIRKVVYNSSSAVIYSYDYLDGFVYTTPGGGNTALTYFNTAEGRVMSNTTATAFSYEYFIKDHAGNTRVSFHDNGSGVAAIDQENEYYAFGMTMQGIVVRTAQPNPANNQLYNAGSDLQNDLGYENSYSTPYREYDPQLGRFNAIDPMVDKYAGLTPYNFAFNDPVGMNDPSGADASSGGSGPIGCPNCAVPGYFHNPYFTGDPYSAGGYAENVWGVQYMIDKAFNSTPPGTNSTFYYNNGVQTGSTYYSSNDHVEVVWMEYGQIDPQSGEHYNVYTNDIHLEVNGQRLRSIEIVVGSDPIGWSYQKSFPYADGIVYKLPTYQLTILGTDVNGNQVHETYEVFRFGVKRESADSKPRVVGRYDAKTKVISAWDPKYKVHSNNTGENGAWVIDGNFLIHDGPDNPRDTKLFASVGCIEITGSIGFSGFNLQLLQLSGASSLNQLGASGQITITYEKATVPVLIPVGSYTFK